MDFSNRHYSRRAMLKEGSAVLATAAAIPLVLLSAPAAATKLAKSDMHYQDRPNDGKRCAECTAFITDPSAAAGACKVVNGPISPDGWCMAFSRKEQRSA